MNNFEEILLRLPLSIASELSTMPKEVIKHVEEIRLRCGQNPVITYGRQERRLSTTIKKEDLQNILNSLIKYSYYAYEEDLAKGFVTIKGGHRVGICGKAVTSDNQPTLIKEISSMNIRFAKEFKGCANVLIPLIIKNDKPINTLIVSPPGCGKTTLLRDIARILSIRGITVGICDERSEIAGMYESFPSFDLGPRTDVIDGCDKIYGIQMLIRTMSPQVIITDEIGKERDIEAVEMCESAGVKVITSIHGATKEELLKSKVKSLILNKTFQNIVYLSNNEGPGTIEEIECV